MDPFVDGGLMGVTRSKVMHVKVSCDPRIDDLISLYIRTHPNPDRQFHCESMEVAREWLRQRLTHLDGTPRASTRKSH